MEHPDLHMYHTLDVLCGDKYIDRKEADAKPVVSSPILEYIQDVNRFLFSGGINPDIIEDPNSSEYQLWLNRVIKHNNLKSVLFSLWKNFSKKGEVLMVALKDKEATNGYNFLYFTPDEFIPFFTGNKLTEIRITRKTDKGYYFRLRLTAESITTYDAFKLNPICNIESWETRGEVIPHIYGVLPCVLAQNNLCLKSRRGRSDFNRVAIDLCRSINRISYSLDETDHFFGHPLIDSPDKKKTTTALNKREQVLEKLPDQDGGGHDILQPDPYSETQLKRLNDKRLEFKRLMGIISPIDEAMGDGHSGKAIDRLTDGLISKAEEKWNFLVGDGLEPFLSLVLEMANMDGYLNLGSLVLADKKVCITRCRPYYTPTPQDRLALCSVASSMLELGLSREYVLKETLFPNLSKEEIKEMINPILEDV